MPPLSQAQPTHIFNRLPPPPHASTGSTPTLPPRSNNLENTHPPSHPRHSSYNHFSTPSVLTIRQLFSARATLTSLPCLDLHSSKSHTKSTTIFSLAHRIRVRHFLEQTPHQALLGLLYKRPLRPSHPHKTSLYNLNSHLPHKMSFDMDWSPDFCLACDRQTDGNVYCSESCRLAEYEQGSNAGSAASSPTSSRGPVSWPSRTSNGFYMEPAYNFSKAQPYGRSTSPRGSTFYQSSRPSSSPANLSSRTLTPSTSQSSLFSMQSTSSTASEPQQLSEESRKALRAYASSFDQSRYSRRQSTN